jgi:hypothetical protein
VDVVAVAAVVDGAAVVVVVRPGAVVGVAAVVVVSDAGPLPSSEANSQCGWP